MLIDTSNLKDKNKTTPKDESAVKFLEDQVRLGETDSPYDREEYYRELSSLKNDLSAMSVRDILRKDYKEWKDESGTLGTSSVVQSLGYLVEKAGSTEQLTRDLESWADERGVDVLSLMTGCKKNGSFARELLVWAVTDKGQDACNKFQELETELRLEPLSDTGLHDVNHEKWRRAWAQNTLACSRKQIAPMMRDAIKRKSNA